MAETTKALSAEVAIGKKVEALLALPAELTTELTAGAKVIACTLHVYGKDATMAKDFLMGFKVPAVSTEPGSNTNQWFTVSLSKAQAEEQTKASLEALVVLLEARKLKTASFVYSAYVSLETEATAAQPSSLSMIV